MGSFDTEGQSPHMEEVWVYGCLNTPGLSPKRPLIEFCVKPKVGIDSF